VFPRKRTSLPKGIDHVLSAVISGEQEISETGSVQQTRFLFGDMEMSWLSWMPIVLGSLVALLGGLWIVVPSLTGLPSTVST